MCNHDPSGMRPEAQLSDPMNCGTLLYTKKLTGRISGAHVQLSPKPWTLGGKLSPDSGITEAPETGYPELVLVTISLRSI